MSALWSQSTCSDIPWHVQPSTMSISHTPSPRPYLADIDPCVLLIIGSVTDSQSQLLLAANAAQLHLLQENTQACMVAFAKGGNNCVARQSTKPTHTVGHSHTHTAAPTHTAQSQDKIFCEHL